jgi:epoxyqueuosine reductase QueG
LEKRGFKAFVIQPTTPYYAQEFRGVISHRHAAIRAGLGVFGKNNLVLTKEFGPRQRFCTVLTDAELVPDPPLKKISVWVAIRAVKGVLFRLGTQSQVSFINRFAHIIRKNRNRADQECKQPCGICIQICPVGKKAVGISD